LGVLSNPLLSLPTAQKLPTDSFLSPKTGNDQLFSLVLKHWLTARGTKGWFVQMMRKKMETCLLMGRMEDSFLCQMEMMGTYLLIMMANENLLLMVSQSLHLLQIHLEMRVMMGFLCQYQCFHSICNPIFQQQC